MKIHQLLNSSVINLPESTMLEAPWTNEQLMQALTPLLRSYTHQTNANNIVNGILHRLPNALYVGPMYRILYLSSDVVLSCKSNSDIIQKIKQYDANLTKKYWSFAKTVPNLQNFIHASNEETEGELTLDMIDVAIVVKQQGRGLDVEEVNKAWNKDGSNWAVKRAASVTEVLAMADQSIKPMGYVVRGIRGKGVASGNSRYYLPHSYYFRTDAFNQMVETLTNMVNGVVKSPRRRATHPKSIMRQLDVY